jgi:hypothetical protein
MSLCAEIGTVGSQAVLVPSAASSGACVTAVVLTPDEYASVMSNPLLLSIDSGTQIALAIGAVWALAWSIRQIGKTLDGDSQHSEE